MSERARTPRDDVYDILTEHFGQPRTRTEQAMFGKVTAELMEAGATPEETRTACVYVIRNFDSPSVFAVPKWFSAALSARPRKSEQEAMLDELRQRREQR